MLSITLLISIIESVINSDNVMNPSQ